VRRADHASRGFLLTVVRRCLLSRNLLNEEALALVGPQRHRKNQKLHSCPKTHLVLPSDCADVTSLVNKRMRCGSGHLVSTSSGSRGSSVGHQGHSLLLHDSVPEKLR
jgi:hypothetical protein